MAFLPFFHIYGQVVVMLGGLVQGATLVLFTTPDIDEILSAMERYQASGFYGVPTLFEYLKEYEKTDRVNWKRLKLIACGAASANPATISIRISETFSVVNATWNRLTIFTSNYKDIPDDTDPNALLFRIGHRMRSRLHEMCDFEVLDGADYRELPTNGGPEDLMMMWKMRSKSLPSPGRSGRQARAQLKEPGLRDGKADLKWSGGRAGRG